MELSRKEGNDDLDDVQRNRVAIELKYKALLEENEFLDKEIDKLRAKGVSTNLQPQMNALHEYNEMKDLTQTVLGYLADVQQVSISALHKLYGLPVD